MAAMRTLFLAGIAGTVLSAAPALCGHGSIVETETAIVVEYSGDEADIEAAKKLQAEEEKRRTEEERAHEQKRKTSERKAAGRAEAEKGAEE